LRTEAKGYQLQQRLPVYPEFMPSIIARPGLLSEKTAIAADRIGHLGRTA
jgi:hypothetical protein